VLNKTKQYAVTVDYGDRYPMLLGPFTEREEAIKEADRRVSELLRSDPSRRAEPNVTSPETFTIVWASEACQRIADPIGAWYVGVREFATPRIRCTSCDEPAVMLWGSVNTEPSCQECGGVVSDDGYVTVQIPLDNMTPFECDMARDVQAWRDSR
jgi:hypothetical protein